MSAAPLLVVRGLGVSYAPARTGGGGARSAVLAGVDLDLEAGGTLAVVGESGAGKSTLLAALVGLLPRGARVDAGSIRFRGEELVGASETTLRCARGRAIGVVFQDALAAFDPVVPIGTQVAETLVAHGACSRGAARERAIELLARCRLPDPAAAARAVAHELSGGMRQRALVASAIAHGPALLLADEPTSALDPTLAADVLDLLEAERATRGTALLVVTHDLALARERCERVAVLHRGRVVETGPARAVFARPAHPYVEELVAARRALETPGAGAPPHAASPRSAVGGCAFARGAGSRARGARRPCRRSSRSRETPRGRSRRTLRGRSLPSAARACRRRRTRPTPRIPPRAAPRASSRAR
ncbi:MAG: ABC transporter ATP-binding protein [Planctomycetes bacterium]|nr:ABC transporter ATP-binding protein [Planctomycetota bacterium]